MLSPFDLPAGITRYLNVKAPAVVTGKITATRLSDKKKITLAVGTIVGLGTLSGSSYTVAHQSQGLLKVPAAKLKKVKVGRAEIVRNTTYTTPGAEKPPIHPGHKGPVEQAYNFAYQGKTLVHYSSYGTGYTSWVPTKDLKVRKQAVYRLTRDVEPVSTLGMPVQNMRLEKGLIVTSFHPLDGLDYSENAQEGYKYITANVGTTSYKLPLAVMKRIGTQTVQLK